MKRSIILFKYLFFVATLLLMVGCSAGGHGSVSGELILPSGETPSTEFKVVLCPVGLTRITCELEESLTAVTVNGAFQLEAVPAGRYGLNLSPPDPWVFTVGLFQTTEGEDLIFRVQDGEAVDLQQLILPPSS